MSHILTKNCAAAFNIEISFLCVCYSKAALQTVVGDKSYKLSFMSPGIFHFYTVDTTSQIFNFFFFPFLGAMIQKAY